MLPQDAISSPEILDEPGLAQANLDAAVLIGNSLTTLVSRTITPPAAGYCVVLASGQVAFTHVAGADDSVMYGISASSSALPPTQDGQVRVPSSLGGGQFSTPAACNAVFPVSGAP